MSVAFLRAMAQMLRPKNVLEIGAGYTTPFLLEALVNNEKESLMTVIWNRRTLETMFTIQN